MASDARAHPRVFVYDLPDEWREGGTVCIVSARHLSPPLLHVLALSAIVDGVVWFMPGVLVWRGVY